MNKGLWLQEKHIITTTSRLRVWWLKTWCGYQICSAAETPEKTVWGGVRLVRHWSLRAWPWKGKEQDAA